MYISPDTEWQLLMVMPNAPLAHALIESLSAQGIATKLLTDSSLLGQGMPCRVMVEATQLHRAQQLIDPERFTDEELTFLATGTLSCDDAKE
jgi:hypothetical protein